MTPAARAGLVGAVVSGAPSTLYALLTRQPILTPTEAAGSILLPRETRRTRLIPAAAGLHLVLSLFWSHILAITLPRGRALLWGSAAGLGIAVLDLLIIGRRWTRVRELPLAPQLADHVAFGIVVAVMLRLPREARRVRLDEAETTSDAHRAAAPQHANP